MFLYSFLFFFKQKTAYEMRISDWSSDVCSSDLAPCTPQQLDQALANTHVDTGGLTEEPIIFTQKDHYGPSSYELYHYDRNSDKVVSTGHVMKAASKPEFQK